MSKAPKPYPCKTSSHRGKQAVREDSATLSTEKKMRRLLRSLYGATLLLCLVIAAAAQSNTSLREITAEDYFAFEFLSDPHISPDGKLAAYVLTKVDRAQNRRNSSVWMVATDGARAPWQFTTAPQSSTSPRWS